eukprot:TRINITY_DN10101_c0_g2_i1.p2 TRINITY_DN10101_c0_g2~~TRINITY_DN10101_c0_g2_i1.p2  ORF type:complete len:214 (+),score=6.99 TRINITY_DN10101_c0_g2_i1:694-1335(+)
MCYKLYDTKWSTFIDKFPGRTESNIKNKFYSTLKKIATQAQLEDPIRFNQNFIKSKNNLIQFVDAAMIYGQSLPSKRGRKRNIERQLAPKKAFLFPPKEHSSRVHESLACSAIIPSAFIFQQQLITQSSFFPSVETPHRKSLSFQPKNQDLEAIRGFDPILKKYVEGMEDRMRGYREWLGGLLNSKSEGGKPLRGPIILPCPVTLNVTNHTEL